MTQLFRVEGQTCVGFLQDSDKPKHTPRKCAKTLIESLRDESSWWLKKIIESNLQTKLRESTSKLEDWYCTDDPSRVGKTDNDKHSVESWVG